MISVSAHARARLTNGAGGVDGIDRDTAQRMMPAVRRMPADVEGYSRLMGADEVGTLKGLTERRAILDRIIGEHKGRTANTAVDSVLWHRSRDLGWRRQSMSAFDRIALSGQVMRRR
jgi:class 3 adenylate cyclase